MDNYQKLIVLALRAMTEEQRVSVIFEFLKATQNHETTLQASIDVQFGFLLHKQPNDSAQWEMDRLANCYSQSPQTSGSSNNDLLKLAKLMAKAPPIVTTMSLKND
jgi:hypothetical protein